MVVYTVTMQSSKFTLIPPEIKPDELLPALETVIPPDEITQAIAETNSKEKRERILPTHVIMTLVIALNFWSTDLIVDVLKNLVAGLASQWIPKRFPPDRVELTLESLRSLAPNFSVGNDLIEGMALSFNHSPLPFLKLLNLLLSC